MREGERFPAREQVVASESPSILWWNWRESGGGGGASHSVTATAATMVVVALSTAWGC